jgi:hypothetical protein
MSKDLSGAFKEWGKIVVEPQSMNEARLFSLEKKLDLTQFNRQKEIESIQTHLIKLIYSIEQAILLDDMESDNLNLSLPKIGCSSLTLPNSKNC